MVDLVGLLVNIIIKIVILAPFLWFAGKSIADPKHVKFTDAAWIVILGTVLTALIGFLGPGWMGTGIISALVGLFVWLLLIKHFFDTTWLKSLAVAIIAVIIMVVVGVFLGFLGIGLLFVLL